ncbi:MAG: TonB-dependent receptor [Bacteroidia bacterium]|nr:TonB-dependent receptor [Bacteroidia bacterium]MCZ2248465.1 TonB-dependent receptor [Bacteroidia bacterium]
MKNYKGKFFLFFLLISQNLLWAQQDSIYLLKGVEISADYRALYNHEGLKVESTDSVFLQNNLNLNMGELLSRLSPVFIKSYGGGSLASSSFRGGSANHTAVIWNGVNLQSPVNGMIDLSLIPTSLFQQISLQYGGNSASWGSGVIGGSLLLESKPVFNHKTKIKMYVGAGSFSQRNLLLAAGVSNRRISHEMRFYGSSALNNYTYQRLEGDSIFTEKLSHAAAKQNNYMQDTYFKIRQNQMLEAHLWVQKNNRLIPPTLYEYNSTALQNDQSTRLNAAYSIYFGHVKAVLKSAYFNDKLIYQDNDFAKPSQYAAQTSVNEFLMSGNINNMILSGGIHHTYILSKNEAFVSSQVFQNRMAIFSSGHYTALNNKLQALISLRQEWMIKGKMPFTYSVGGNYLFTKWLDLKANISKVFRFPTLNDMYWKEGGNKNLLPESGYAYEGGIVFKPITKVNQRLTIEMTAFSKIINNWIIWLPQGSFWSPQNLYKVWSRGTESNSTYTYTSKQMSLLLNFKTSYVLSENMQSQLINDESVNKQLIYIPLYSGQFNWRVGIKKFGLLFTHSYTGYRYTSSDHSTYLNPYFLHHANATYTFSLNKISLDLQLYVQNILNTSYQAISSRPMPGRSIGGGIVFNFN